MSLTGKRIVFPIGPLFEESELIFPYYRFKEEGAEVVICGTLSKQECSTIKGKHGYKVFVDVSVCDLDFDTVHAVVVPGGFSPDYVRSNERVQALVHHVHSKGGVAAGICHGPWVLVSANIMKDKQCTSYKTIKDDMVNSGACWSDEPVVVDNRIVTSRCPDDLPVFCKAVIEEMKKLKW